MPEPLALTDDEGADVYAFAHWLRRLDVGEVLGELTEGEIEQLVNKYPGMAAYRGWHMKRSRAARKGAATRRRIARAKADSGRGRGRPGRAREEE